MTSSTLLAVAHPHARRSRGFTLIEVMIATAITGVLSSVAYPSFMGTVHKVRRTDAMVTMLQVQAAEERWRAGNPSYGSLTDIRQPATTASNHYALELRAANENGYEVVASARGAQSRDRDCAVMKMSVSGLNATYASGPDANLGNGTDTNRRCWNL